MGSPPPFYVPLLLLLFLLSTKKLLFFECVGIVKVTFSSIFAVAFQRKKLYKNSKKMLKIIVLISNDNLELVA